MSLSLESEKALISTSPWLYTKESKSSERILKYEKWAIKKRYKKGSYLIYAGDIPDGLFFVKEGIVEGCVVDENGTEMILTISYRNSFLGEEVLFHHQPVIYYAKAVTDVVAYFFDQNIMLNILKEDFELTQSIMYSMAIRVRVLANQIDQLMFRSTYEKVIRTLYCYSSMNETNNFAISHRILASIVGAHRVSITNVIGVLKEKGIVDTKYGKIIIKDQQALKEMAFKNI